MKKPNLFLIMTTIALLAQPFVPQSVAEEKNVTDAAPKKKDFYKVASKDVLNIIVYQEPDLSGDFEVKEDGSITFPLLGVVKVGDLTKSQIEDRLRVLLEDGYLVNPYVMVSIRKYGTVTNKSVMILGQVNKPGTCQLADNSNMTVLKAIADCGGFTRLADINGTRIVRTGEGGKKITINPKANDIITGRQQDVKLEPDDMIIVPERLF